MEVLQSGNDPTIVTNVEVMQLLQERIAARQQTLTPNGGAGVNDESHSNNRKNPFQNRDWIEQTVLNHLQSSPVGRINNEKLLGNMPKLVEILRRDPGTSGGDVIINSHTEVGDGEQQHQHQQHQEEQLDGYGLTKMETLQILNHLPTSLVELHLLIDDLEKREHLDEDEKQLKLLRLISQFAGNLGNENAGG